MTWAALIAALARAFSSAFDLLRTRQLFRSGVATAERDDAKADLSRLDKIKRFRDRAELDPAYAGELQRKYGAGRSRLRDPAKAPDKPV